MPSPHIAPWSISNQDFSSYIVRDFELERTDRALDRIEVELCLVKLKYRQTVLIKAGTTIHLLGFRWISLVLTHVGMRVPMWRVRAKSVLLALKLILLRERILERRILLLQSLNALLLDNIQLENLHHRLLCIREQLKGSFIDGYTFEGLCSCFEKVHDRFGRTSDFRSTLHQIIDVHCRLRRRIIYVYESLMGRKSMWVRP
jgi:hypothetical protein